MILSVPRGEGRFGSDFLVVFPRREPSRLAEPVALLQHLVSSSGIHLGFTPRPEYDRKLYQPLLCRCACLVHCQEEGKEVCEMLMGLSLLISSLERRAYPGVRHKPAATGS